MPPTIAVGGCASAISSRAATRASSSELAGSLVRTYSGGSGSPARPTAARNASSRSRPVPCRRRGAGPERLGRAEVGDPLVAVDGDQVLDQQPDAGLVVHRHGAGAGAATGTLSKKTAGTPMSS